MNRYLKNMNLWRVGSLLALMCGSPLAAEELHLSVRPHIVHVIADDLGWNDVGFHGSEIETPRIDALAGESVVLDRFYVAPICSPTRAGVLTGRYPFRFGIWKGVISPFKRHGLPPSELTTPEYLAKAGYKRRGMFGKWHLGLASSQFHPNQHGFTYFYGHYNGAIDYFSHERAGEVDWHRNEETLDEAGYSTDLIGDEAARFILEHPDESPFYMVVAFNAPHSPIQATTDQLDRYSFDPEGPRAPNTDRKIAMREKAPAYGEAGKGNTIRQTYSAMVSSLDDNLGKILDALQRRGIEERTIVIFHSDNGGTPVHGGSNQPLRGNKFTTWEGGVRVVAMIRWPEQLAAGRYRGVAAYIDLLPTLLKVVNLAPERPVDGVDLFERITSQMEPPERYVLLGERTVVGQRWKLNEDEFYDLSTNPNESAPVAQPPTAVMQTWCGSS